MLHYADIKCITLCEKSYYVMHKLLRYAKNVLHYAAITHVSHESAIARLSTQAGIMSYRTSVKVFVELGLRSSGDPSHYAALYSNPDEKVSCI